MLSADTPPLYAGATLADDEPQVSLAELLTWIGEKKRFIGLVTLLAALASVAYALLTPPIYTARSTLLAPARNSKAGRPRHWPRWGRWEV